MKEFCRKWKWLLATSAAIIVISLIPIPEKAPLDDVPFIDKWVHFVMYGAIVFAAWFDAVRNKTERISAWFILAVFLYSSLLGGFMELLQGLTPYRSCDSLDFYADVFGALLASAVVSVVACLHRGRRPS